MLNNKYINNHTNDEGLLPSIWGPPTWDSLHCITFNYPLNPTYNDKKHYKDFFESLCYVLPCCTCRESYSNFIKIGDTLLSNDVMENRHTLTYWLYIVHNTVDKKLGMSYDITYDDLCNKYESYIINCKISLEQKSIMYKHAYNIEAPILDFNLVLCFNEYAIKREIDLFNNNVNNTRNIKKGSDEWIKRNEKCWEIIKNMRINAIPSIEPHGKYKGLPTLNELELLQLMSSSMSNKLIKHIIKKIGIITIPKYQFVK